VLHVILADAPDRDERRWVMAVARIATGPRELLPYTEPTGRASQHTVGRPARLFRGTG